MKINDLRFSEKMFYLIIIIQNTLMIWLIISKKIFNIKFTCLYIFLLNAIMFTIFKNFSVFSVVLWQINQLLIKRYI